MCKHEIEPSLHAEYEKGLPQQQGIPSYTHLLVLAHMQINFHRQSHKCRPKLNDNYLHACTGTTEAEEILDKKLHHAAFIVCLLWKVHGPHSWLRDTAELCKDRVEDQCMDEEGWDDEVCECRSTSSSMGGREVLAIFACSMHAHVPFANLCG